MALRLIFENFLKNSYNQSKIVYEDEFYDKRLQVC